MSATALAAVIAVCVTALLCVLIWAVVHVNQKGK